jgi:hypothetical protein
MLNVCVNSVRVFDSRPGGGKSVVASKVDYLG